MNIIVKIDKVITNFNKNCTKIKNVLKNSGILLQFVIEYKL